MQLVTSAISTFLPLAVSKKLKPIGLLNNRWPSGMSRSTEPPELMSAARITWCWPLVAMAEPSATIWNCALLGSYFPVAGFQTFNPVANSVYELTLVWPCSSMLTVCQIRWCGPVSTTTGPAVTEGSDTCAWALRKQSAVMVRTAQELVFIGDYLVNRSPRGIVRGNSGHRRFPRFHQDCKSV